MQKTILVYDDDEDILTLCSLILSEHGFKVQTKINCDDILNDISSINPDLILMDLWIPEIGGEKAIKLLKEEGNKDIPVIIFSATTELESICKRINADGYIEKPFSVLQLVDDIKKFLKK